MHIGITSGYFNPISENHLILLKDAKSRCDILLVIVNNDKQVLLKGSCPFQDEKFRRNLIKELKCVDGTHIAIDEDGSITQTLKMIVNNYTEGYRTLDTIIGQKRELKFSFFKGGDRAKPEDLPASEVEICKDLDISIVFGVGGFEKTAASSTSLQKAFKWYLQKVEAMSKEEKLAYFKKIGI